MSHVLQGEGIYEGNLSSARHALPPLPPPPLPPHFVGKVAIYSLWLGYIQVDIREDELRKS
jgi:hypothetical protein